MVDIAIAEGDEKSIFERAIIEAFKQKTNKGIIEKLTIAYDEIKFLVNDTKDYNSSIDKSNIAGLTKRYILNVNILDKLRRLTERNFFCVKMVVGRIFEKLLNIENFPYLSADADLLIKFSNEILDLLEDLKTTSTAFVLERKCLNFMNYLKQSIQLNYDQLIVIEEILKSLPFRSSSEAYIKFDATKDRIVNLCKAESSSSKVEGINLLMETFALMNSLEEQFEVLIEKVPIIIRALIHKPNPDMKEAYFQIGHFLCSMLFNFSFVLDSDLSNFKFNEKSKDTVLYFIKDETIMKETSIHKLDFLSDVKFELTTQKEILLKSECIVKICLQVIRTLCVYEKIFDLQYVCYVLLRRLYFTFTLFRNAIEDDLVLILVNICLFTGKYEITNSQDCRMFIQHLLQQDDTIRAKLLKRIEAKNVSIELEIPKSKMQSKPYL